MHLDKILTKEFLEKEIIQNKKLVSEIAREQKISKHTIYKYAKKYNINLKLDKNLELKEILGKKFNNLTLIERAQNDRFGKVQILCKCDCGNLLVINKASILKGLTKSCGCLKKEILNKKSYKDISWQYFKKTRDRAINRNLEFDLSIEDIWNVFEKQNFKCALSGLEINFHLSAGEKSTLQSASIDRINSDLGYTKNNIQIVHKWINICKWALDNEEFIYMCNLVALRNQINENDIKKGLPNIVCKIRFRDREQP